MYAIAQYVAGNGPCSRDDIINSVPRYTRKQLQGSIVAMTANGRLLCANDAFTLAHELRPQFRDHKNAVVPSRYVNVFTPELKGYEASMRRNIRGDAYAILSCPSRHV